MNEQALTLIAENEAKNMRLEAELEERKRLYEAELEKRRKYKGKLEECRQNGGTRKG